MAESNTIGFDLLDEIPSFVEGVPIEAIHKSESIDQTARDLRAELRRRACLPSFDWTNMGLSNTDDAVVNALKAIVIHLLLLPGDLTDHQQIFVLVGGEKKNCPMFG